ncbi:serine/threonine protein kinase [Arthrobacter citreus]|nr:serine/threonine protein kinase [Arthrobacter citreus]
MYYIIGDVIDGRYEALEEVGEGGFGQVLKVQDIHTSEIVALKYCSKSNPEDIARFKREVRIMENINQENVINILHTNIENSPPYFVMPLALTSVTNIIPKVKNDLNRVFEIFEAICKGISAIHISGLTHRDIKPDNALVFEDGKIVVSDLGLAKFDIRDTTVLTRASVNVGTFDYMPPEQFLYGGTRDLDHRGDIFQLGKTLYQLLTGLRPAVMDSTAVPTGLWYVIQKATRQNPDERYQTVGQLLDALNDARRSTDPSMNPEGVFMQLIEVAEENLKEDQYSSVNVNKILQTIYSFDDMEEYIELFGKIPEQILRVCASNMPTEFEPILIKYNKGIDERIGEYAFLFAEAVSRKMKIVVRNTDSPELKKYGIITTLMAANRLNRYAAMDAFDELLKNIRDDKDAYAVADGLRDAWEDYRYLYDRIPKKELHPAIQVVWESCN